MVKQGSLYGITMAVLLLASYCLNTHVAVDSSGFGRATDWLLNIAMVMLVLRWFWLFFSAVKTKVNSSENRRTALPGKKILVAALLFFALLGALATEIGDRSIRNEWVVTEALAQAQISPIVRSALGTGIHAGWPITGTYHFTNLDGSATISVPVVGSHGRGKLHVEGVKAGGSWSIQVVDFHDGTTQQQPVLK